MQPLVSDTAVIVFLLGQALFAWWLAVLQSRAADARRRIATCEHKSGHVSSFDGHLTYHCDGCPFQTPLYQLRYYREGSFYLRQTHRPDPYRPLIRDLERKIDGPRRAA